MLTCEILTKPGTFLGGISAILQLVILQIAFRKITAELKKTKQQQNIQNPTYNLGAIRITKTHCNSTLFPKAMFLQANSQKHSL